MEEPPSTAVPKEVLRAFRRAVQALPGRVTCLLPLRYSYVPLGWYFLEPGAGDGGGGREKEDDGEGAPGIYIPVLPHQKRGFSRLFSDIARGDPGSFRRRGYGDLVRTYFYDCPDPLPDEETLREFTGAVPSGEKSRAPAAEEGYFFPFKARDEISPWTLSRGDGAAPPAAAPLYKKYPLLRDFYPRDAELLHDIALCGLYRTWDEGTPPGIDPAKCEKFIEANIREERVIPHKEILADLAREYPDLVSLPGATRIVPVEFRWDAKRAPPAPLGFCRFPDDSVELHLADVLRKKAVPRAAREYVISHLLAHASAPYEHYGPVLSAGDRKFRPTRTAAREFLSLPVWENREAVAADGAWARVCRAFLAIVIRVASGNKTPVLDEYL